MTWNQEDRNGIWNLGWDTSPAGTSSTAQAPNNKTINKLAIFFDMFAISSISEQDKYKYLFQCLHNMYCPWNQSLQ